MFYPVELISNLNYRIYILICQVENIRLYSVYSLTITSLETVAFPQKILISQKLI